MKIAFAGTPEFARIALAAIDGADHDVVLVLSQPDRPKGRGLQLAASPVTCFARERGLALLQPQGLRLDGKFPEDAERARLGIRSAAPDIMVVAAYGLLLPPWLLELPRLGCLNIHASLLPRWRGAAPIQRAIEAGDAVSGITIMQMAAGLDTGPIVLQEALPILPHDTAGSLQDRLGLLGADLILAALERLHTQGLQAVEQPEAGVTYAAKIQRDEARLDFSRSAEELARKIRAFNPHPGAFAMLNDIVVKIWQADALEPIDHTEAIDHPPKVAAGSILGLHRDGLAVACGRGTLLATTVQRAGGTRLAAREFLKGLQLPQGSSFL